MISINALVRYRKLLVDVGVKITFFFKFGNQDFVIILLIFDYNIFKLLNIKHIFSLTTSLRRLNICKQNDLSIFYLIHYKNSHILQFLHRDI